MLGSFRRFPNMSSRCASVKNCNIILDHFGKGETITQPEAEELYGMSASVFTSVISQLRKENHKIGGFWELRDSDGTGRYWVYDYKCVTLRDQRPHTLVDTA